MSPDLLPSQRLCWKDRFLLFRFNRNQGSLDGWQDSGEGTSVSLVEVEERVGEILNRIVAVDVGHDVRKRSGGGSGRRVSTEDNEDNQTKPIALISRNWLSVKSPIFNGSFRTSYLSIKPSTLMTQCDFFHLSLYR